MSEVLSRMERSRLARKTINETIPHILRASTRARSGVEGVKLLKDDDLPRCQRLSKENNTPVIRVVSEDTLEAAYRLMHQSTPNSSVANSKVAVLSMASELRPGGGFLTGSSAQEESLCMRTTLYTSLRDEFYRLPELGCIYTPDVCIFRGQYQPREDDIVSETVTQPSASLTVNPKTAWWFVDVISCAAVRSPDVNEHNMYADPRQKDLMREKIKRILRAAALYKCRRVVLGAFGCGAFGNPAREVAQLFKRVILGRDSHGAGNNDGGEFSGCFDEIIFAIKGGPEENLACFMEVFSDPNHTS